MKAVALLSGGLDSILAAKIIAQQGIEVIPVNFTTPFFGESDKKQISEIAKKSGFDVKFISLGLAYFNNVVKKPRHGYGKNMNPCIDCKIYLLKKAKQFADKVGAQFIITGEVLGQRPMSQQKRELQIIEDESGLKGLLLRPLSAKLLEPTEAEKNGWVSRDMMLQIEGRQRNIQFGLAEKFKIKEFKSPAGGCLLTCEDYARKVKDLIEKEDKTDLNDLRILKVGRHFRFNKSKIIVGRNEKENNKIQEMKKATDIELEVADDVGPVTILRGSDDMDSIQKAAELTAFYSDSKNGDIRVKYNDKEIVVRKLNKSEVDALRI